ncbi:MAG TPA: hypothetical protein VGO43_08795 [Pyrinomonadaceae bacterium]|jgi:hypothetical protein|nr:hypothetical protein [Pyrinomonadaceae bacterium]
MTPETRYWITLFGIFACGIVIGLAMANLRVLWTAQEDRDA